MSNIQIADIVCNQNRDQGDITTLANSIQRLGLLQPIILKKTEDKYEVVDGRRRFAAIQQLGWTVLPENAFTFAAASDDMAVIAHVANVERKNLSPAEEVRQLAALAETHSVDYLAELFGRTPGYITRRLKISTLIPDWLKVLDDPELAPLWPLDKLALIARQTNQVQKKLSHMINNHWSREDIADHIEEYNRQLSAATFDTAPCLKCRNNSATQKLLFDDTDAKDGICLNADCWVRKTLEVVKKTLKDEKLIPIKGNNTGWSNPAAEFADKVKAESEYHYKKVRAPKKGEKANAIIVSGDGIGRHVVAVEYEKTAAANHQPKEKKPLTVKEQEAVLKKKRTKKALELLREKFAEKDFVEKFIAGEEKGALLDHFLLCLSLWGFRGECFQHYGIRIDKKAAAGVIDLETFFPKKFYPQLVAHITDAMRCELTKTLDGINPEAGPALCQLFKLDWAEFYQSASIAVPEPKSLTEAKAKRKSKEK